MAPLRFFVACLWALTNIHSSDIDYWTFFFLLFYIFFRPPILARRGGCSQAANNHHAVRHTTVLPYAVHTVCAIRRTLEHAGTRTHPQEDILRTYISPMGVYIRRCTVLRTWTTTAVCI